MINKNKAALSAGLTGGIMYVFCAIFVWILPDLSLKLVGWLAHMINLQEKLSGNMTLTIGGIVAGSIEVFIYLYVVGWIFAAIYNKLTRSNQSDQKIS